MHRQHFEYDPAFGYRFVRGLRTRVQHEGGGYLVRTNAAGFRCDHEFATERRQGTVRVLLFGDSYTAGDGVSNAARYGNVLEQLLPGVEVFNFAMPGTGTDQHYLIWRECAREIEHDLVIIAVQVENIRRIAARWREFRNAADEPMLLAKPWFSLEPDGSLALHNVPVPREPVAPDALPDEERPHVDRGGNLIWLRQAVSALGPQVKHLVQRLAGQNPLPAYDDPGSDEWRLMSAILRQWIGEIRAPVILLPLPLYHYVEEISRPDAYLARFRELAAEFPDVTVHDPLPDFHVVPLAERRAFRFERDIHPTPAAHRLIAESLARAVERFAVTRA